MKKNKPLDLSDLSNIAAAIEKVTKPYLLEEARARPWISHLTFFAERKIDLYYPFSQAHGLATYQAIAY